MQKVRYTLEWFRICWMHIVHGWGLVRSSFPHESSRLLCMHLLLDYMVSFCISTNKWLWLSLPWCLCRNKMKINRQNKSLMLYILPLKNTLTVRSWRPVLLYTNHMPPAVLHKQNTATTYRHCLYREEGEESDIASAVIHTYRNWSWVAVLKRSSGSLVNWL